MNKKVLANLEKCYSIAPLHYKNTDHILVAAEKTDRCILFDINGQALEKYMQHFFRMISAALMINIS